MGAAGGSVALLPRCLYVASYLPAGPSAALSELANATAGFDMYRKFDFMGPSLEERPHMHRNTLALFEWLILERAELFIGHCRSSMSRQIKQRRKRKESVLVGC